jgi:hypothetical protein
MHDLAVDEVGAADHHVAEDRAVALGDERELRPVARVGADVVDELGLDVGSERGGDDPTDVVEVARLLGPDVQVRTFESRSMISSACWTIERTMSPAGRKLLEALIGGKD